jgi:hypothetical protein
MLLMSLTGGTHESLKSPTLGVVRVVFGGLGVILLLFWGLTERLVESRTYTEVVGVYCCCLGLTGDTRNR